MLMELFASKIKQFALHVRQKLRASLDQSTWLIHSFFKYTKTNIKLGYKVFARLQHHFPIKEVKGDCGHQARRLQILLICHCGPYSFEEASSIWDNGREGKWPGAHAFWTSDDDNERTLNSNNVSAIESYWKTKKFLNEQRPVGITSGDDGASVQPPESFILKK